MGRADQTTTTDEKVSFTISFGRLGVVTVMARNFGTASRRWPPRIGGVTLRIELEPPVSVSGTLVDMVSGRAVAGAITILMRQATSIVSSTAIAERGEFRFRDLPSGSALVISRADGYAPGVAAATLEPKVGGNSVRVALLLEAQAAGTVVDSAGDPVAEAEVLIAYLNSPGAGVLESYVGGRLHTEADNAHGDRNLVCACLPVSDYAED